MSRVESDFIPLPRVEQEQPSEYGEIRLNLPPFVDQDRIGVNVSRMDSLSRLSGFKRLTILGKTGEETSETMPNIVGLNPDGSAMASKSVAKLSVPTFDSMSQTAYESRSQRRANVTIGINIDEIAEKNRILGNDARSPKLYIKEVDKAVRTGIRTEGNHNLVGKHTLNWLDLLNDTLMNYNLFVAPFSAAAERWDVFSIQSFVVGLNGFIRIMRWKMPNGRLSYFLGPELDRAAVLQVKARTQKIVSDLHPEKK